MRFPFIYWIGVHTLACCTCFSSLHRAPFAQSLFAGRTDVSLRSIMFLVDGSCLFLFPALEAPTALFAVAKERVLAAALCASHSLLKPTEFWAEHVMHHGGIDPTWRP